MRRITGLFLVLTVSACGTTLPSEESVLLSISKVTVNAGEEISAVLVNASTEVIGTGILPCTARIIEAVSGQPISPPSECEQPLIGVRPGGRYAFTFGAPSASGRYQFEIPLVAPDADAAWEALNVRSAVFTVSGPEPASP